MCLCTPGDLVWVAYRDDAIICVSNDVVHSTMLCLIWCCQLFECFSVRTSSVIVINILYQLQPWEKLAFVHPFVRVMLWACKSCRFEVIVIASLNFSSREI